MIRSEHGSISITERAATVVKDVLTVAGVGDDQGLRLSQVGDGTFMTRVDLPRSNDEVLRCLWAPVLIAGPSEAAAIEGGVLDIHDGPPPEDDPESGTMLLHLIPATHSRE